MPKKKQQKVFQAPKGMRDLLPDDQIFWEKLTKVLTNLAYDYGFQKIETPILEESELFIRGTGETTDIVTKQMFSLKTAGGTNLTLRPEGTPGVCRAYLENGMASWPQPVKLFYYGPMFRYEQPQAGRYRQMFQFGIENIGEVNLGASKEYEDIEKRFQFLSSQEEDLLQSINSLQKVITKINSITRQKFFDTFNEINKHFQELFPLLFNGGKAYMELTDETDLLETGIEVFARPPGKKLQSLDLLSGGERALTVIALMFSIFLTKPSPFCLMDEIDAPLDDSNLERFIKHLHKMSERSQFIIVTHNKISMQAANSLYGITMEERGVSKVVSVELN